MPPPRSRPSKVTPHPDRPAAPGSRRRWRWLLLAIPVVFIGGGVFADWWICLPDDATANYVGGKSCAQCHQQQAEQWHGSYHDLAMDPATPQTVLGDFNNAELTHFGVTSRMFRRDDKYWVHTEGSDGKLAEFEVKYVLGVSPLQQYMVEFDRAPDAKENEVGRLQVLPISWDTNHKKWFFLQPPDVNERILPGDDLHWTGIAQRWNFMCADCHTTNLQKNFDVESRTYRTRFTEMDVNCETCHGPASLHVQLASATSLFWDRKRNYGLANLKDKNNRVQVETCAPCHSMRHIVYPGYRAGEPYFDYFENELLQGHLYHADGQILEEVYEFGSFAQSKMYHKDIRCSDCHDPHTTKVKYVGNQVCTSCHQHPAGKYDSPSHHHHNPGREGAQCTSCHMPKKTYMAVDPRLDHSLRIPRPDLSVRAGTPNACSGCHLDRGGASSKELESHGEYDHWLRAAREGDERSKQVLAKTDEWAAEKFREWYGKKPDESTHFANALAAARRGDPSAQDPLETHARDQKLAGIVRATCLFELGQFDSDRVTRTASNLLADPEPLVRIAALNNLERLPDDQLVRRVAPLLDDPLRAVRVQAGRILARVDISRLNGPQRKSRNRAIEEFREGLHASSDRAGSHLGLGVLAEQLRDDAAAKQAYETAIRVEGAAAGARSNLAALLERQLETAGDEATATALKQRVTQLRREELELLARDAKHAPQNAIVRYRYGLLLYLNGRIEEAEKELQESVRLSPNTPDFLLALALLYQKQQRVDLALELTRKLVALRPNDESFQQLFNELRRESEAKSPP